MRATRNSARSRQDAFHAGQRNDGTTCSWCHTPNRGSGGWSADSVAFMHGIHAAAKRTNDYTWHAVDSKGVDNPADFEDFSSIGYPGVLAQLRAVPPAEHL